MKKIFVIVLITLLSMSILAACGKGDDSDSGGKKELSVKKLGDAFEATNADGATQWVYDENKYVYVFENEGITYRVIADLTKEIYDEMEAIDFFDEERDDKFQNILSEVEVRTFENLSALIPPQEETDKLVGKTGQELFDDDWSYWYYDLENMEVGMNHDVFDYTVKFDYDGPKMENTDDFDFYEEFKDLTVSEIICNGIGDATEVE